MSEVEVLDQSSQTQLQRSTPSEQVITDLPGITREEVTDPPKTHPDMLPSETDVNGSVRAKKPFYKRPLLLAVASISLIAGLLFGVRYYNYAMSYESTDDAFIEGHIIQISPKVAGHVSKVYVTDNQEVKEGDLLAEINPRDYEVRLAQAQAALQTAISKQKAAQIQVELTDVTSSANVEQTSSGVQLAKSAVETARAQVMAARRRLEQAHAQVMTAQANAEQARAQVLAAEAEAKRARADAQRYQQLYEGRIVSRQQFDNVTAAARTADAQLEAARKKAVAGKAQVAEAQAAERAAAESLHQAESQVAEAQGSTPGLLPFR